MDHLFLPGISLNYSALREIDYTYFLRDIPQQLRNSTCCFLAYDNMCNLANMKLWREPLPIKAFPNMWKDNLIKIIDSLHLHNHIRTNCHIAGLGLKNPARKNPPEKTRKSPPEKTQPLLGFFGFFRVFNLFLDFFYLFSDFYLFWVFCHSMNQ